MYVLYVSLENLLYSERKFLSLKLIHCQKSHGTKKNTNFIRRGSLLLKFKTIQIFEQLNEYAFKAMFTLYRIVKRSVAESAPDRASVHTRNAAFEAVSALEQYCSAPLLKVERSVSDRFLRRSVSSLNTFIAAEIATEPRIGKLSFQIKRERCKLHNG